MSEQQFCWNYFENEVVIGDRQDKKRMIVIVFSNFMDIPYNRKYIDELVDWLNGQQATISRLEGENEQLKKVNNILYNENIQLRRILVNYKDLINDVKYLEEKGVFDGKKDKKNIWDVEPVVEKHS